MSDKPDIPRSHAGEDRAVFIWKDYSRFVQVAPVERGWLVMWGHYRDAGRNRQLQGNRTYVDLEGARRRVVDSAFELTRNWALASEALVRFDRTPFPHHVPRPLDDPL